MTVPRMSQLGRHELVVLATAEQASQKAAELICELLTQALLSSRRNSQRHERSTGRASVAFSGGSSPKLMFQALATVRPQPDWLLVDVFQVDERVAADGDPSRNLVDLQHQLVDRLGPKPTLHKIPVQNGAKQAAVHYANTMSKVLGDNAVLDVVHLGLGTDGHCASLVPGDSALEVIAVNTAATQTYQGHERVTMTYPMLNRAKCVLWLVTGESKRAALAALLREDLSIPAVRMRAARSIIVADQSALSSADQSALSSADQSALSSADQSAEHVGERNGGLGHEL